MRRLPVYILIDTSGSMRGEPIEAVKVGLADMISTLRQDPYALETVSISIITYDREVKQILPLTELENLQLPHLTTPESGPTHMGAALELLCSRADVEVHRSTKTERGDWAPLLFILTDGKPSDTLKYEQMVPHVKSRGFANIVAFAAGPHAKTEPLKLLTAPDKIFTLDEMDAASFRKLFMWVSDVIKDGGKSVGAVESNELPPPPSAIVLSP